MNGGTGLRFNSPGWTIGNVLRVDIAFPIEPTRDGGFLFYLRRALMNKIRDTLRRAVRRPADCSLPEELTAAEPSPLEHLIGTEMLEAYEQALVRLDPRQQEALLLRVELGLSYEEVAEAIGSPNAHAARMVVRRAMLRLVEVLDGR